MKAVYFEKNGGLEVLKYGDIATQKPKEGEALVRVKACALNRLDIWLRTERVVPYPHVLGSDVSGIVEEIKGKSKLKPGQEVVVNPSIPCKTCSNCKNKKDCELVKIFGAKTWGGYAEYVIVPIEQLYQKPKGLSFVEASAFPLTFLTAWSMLVTKVKLKKGETVFVWGASGGLGIAAIQLAKYLGAKVIAAAKSEDIASRPREIGADHTVVYTKEKVEEVVKKITDNQGVDVVFESVGEKTWNTSLSILKTYGRLVIAGTTSGDMGTQDLSDIYVRQLSIFGARMGTKEEFEKVLEIVAAGKLKPIIDKTFSLK